MNWNDMSLDERGRYYAFCRERYQLFLRQRQFRAWKEYCRPRKLREGIGLYAGGWADVAPATPIMLGGDTNFLVTRYDKYYLQRFLWKSWSPESVRLLASRGFGCGI